MSMSWVCVGFEPGLGPDDLLEDQHVARVQIEKAFPRVVVVLLVAAAVLIVVLIVVVIVVPTPGIGLVDPAVDERGSGRPDSDAALVPAPGVEADAVVLRPSAKRPDPGRLEHDSRSWRCRHHGVPRHGRGRGRCIECRHCHQCAIQLDRVGHDETHPGASVASLVQVVVDEPRMSSHRHPLARGLEVGLGCDCVLIIREPVPDIGEQFDECDADIGNVALAPARDKEREPVEHDASQPVPIPGEIVDGDIGAILRRAIVHFSAVELARAAGFEVDIDARVPGVETGERHIGRSAAVV